MADALTVATVAAVRAPRPVYPQQAPFHPSTRYPEYAGPIEASEPNVVYDAVREAMALLGLDRAHRDTSAWNPLGEVVRPGDRVVLKPNFLAEAHRRRPDEWMQVVTHGSVIRAVLDYVLLALQGRGEVVVADGPQYDSDWNGILQRTGTASVVDYCRARSGIPVRLMDLRDYQQVVRGDVIYDRVALASDPLGGVEIDLGDASAFVGHDGHGRYYGSDYNQAETNTHHSGGRHEYRISATCASADVFINLPKLKTHKKVGVTLSLKNLVGINVGRNWLPHHTDGAPESGGDQFPRSSLRGASERTVVRWLQKGALRSRTVARAYRLAKTIARPVYGATHSVTRHGNWYGNDTAWRMVLDINRCLLYSGGGGGAFPAPGPKRWFAFVDGIIGGDGDGPANPDAHPAGIIVAGGNPVAVDCACARLMGFDPLRIRQLASAFQLPRLPLAAFDYADIRVESNVAAWRRPVAEIPADQTLAFRPHFAWRGAIELGRGDVTR